jgi:TatD DNase family protein
MQLVDTHSHIFAAEFCHDLTDVIGRAKDAGIIYMVLPNIDSSSISALHSVTNQFPNFCLPCMGLHPTSVNSNVENELQIVEHQLNKQDYIGIGEIGIDLYWDKTFLEQQKLAFRHQLKLAKKFHLPVIIHSRNSFDEIFEIVDQENDSSLRGIFHSFSGTLEHYKHIVEYGGFMIGIGGVVTYKNGGIDKIINEMGINHIVLETDSPYLSPIPHRGKRNESSYIVYVAQKIAEIKDIPIEQVAKVTTQNACKLFQIELK